MKTAPIRSLLLARPGTLARGALLLFFSLSGVCASFAEEGRSLPEGAVTHIGMPPLYPYEPRDKASVQALCERLVAQGRALVGTRVGGDYLFSAAYAHEHFLEAPKTAAPLYAEALAAYPRGDPTRGSVLAEQARYELTRGNHPRAKAVLTQLTSWTNARSPANLGAADAARWRLLGEALARRLPPLRADLAESEGRYADAAQALTGMLNGGEAYLLAWERASAWERVARWQQRAGDKQATGQAIDEALEYTADESRQADLRFWRLHADHGLIAADGGPVISRTWPGLAFERDLRVFLRTVQGVEGTGTTYLALASTAFRAGRKEIALEIYLLALRAPDLVEAARGDSSLWRGLLMGYAAALDLERFDEAEQVLSIVERIADEPIEEIDDYRIAIREGRAAKRLRQARAKEAPAPEPSAAEASPTRRPLGAIATPSRPDEPELGTLQEEEEDASPDWLWLASAVLLAIALVLLLARRRHA